LRLAWDVVLELNGEWREKLEIAGDVDGNSGGNVLFLSPGVRLTVSERVALALSFGIPIATALNGAQVEPDYRIVSGVSVSF
jgi:hypothetical protein